MKIETIKLIDYHDIMREFERLTGLNINTSGEWNAPPERHLLIDLDSIGDHSGYYRAESKIAVFVCLDKPHDKSWKTLEYPTDSEEFLKKYGTVHLGVPQCIKVGFFDMLEFLVVSGSLPRSEEILICYAW